MVENITACSAITLVLYQTDMCTCVLLVVLSLAHLHKQMRNHSCQFHGGHYIKTNYPDSIKQTVYGVPLGRY